MNRRRLLTGIALAPLAASVPQYVLLGAVDGITVWSRPGDVTAYAEFLSRAHEASWIDGRNIRRSK